MVRNITLGTHPFVGQLMQPANVVFIFTLDEYLFKSICLWDVVWDVELVLNGMKHSFIISRDTPGVLSSFFF